MIRRSSPSIAAPRPRLHSFTLIELLLVIAIIALLASLVLYAGLGVMAKAARSRASAEIQAMSAALESYKTDNGVYPPSDGSLSTNSYGTTDPSVNPSGWTNSQLVYLALSGQTNFTDTPVAGRKAYMSFKANQVGNPSGPYTYVKDPWNNAYQYSTGAGVNTPYNGSGFFDLFSTGNQKGTTLNTNQFIQNW